MKSLDSPRAPEKVENPLEYELGLRLRELRQSRSLSLADVAEATGISASFLSLLELGRSDVSIGRLTRLVQFYEVPFADLVPGAERRDPDIVRSTERGRLHSEAEGIDIYLLTSDTTGGMMSMLLEFAPGAGRKEAGAHAGKEFIHVLAGRLHLELEGAASRVLEAGDSAYYDGHRPHLFRNASEKKALQLLCVNSSRRL
jgi:transcriptional regulator with XRE-family HTH domain